MTEKIQALPKARQKDEIIEHIPPPIFSIDINLRTKNKKGPDIDFKTLSSGEKQMIYSISSLLYHLINLDSIPNSRTRVGYKYINIILEEVELYFHPEMQRRYIHNILDSINRINLSRINAINICFVTHSPFILSDIPGSNILFLSETGGPEARDEDIGTFGGNIHELLATSFFLGSGTIGEFAKQKIQSIIDSLNPDEEFQNTEISKESVMKEIQVIGEPFLKGKLMEMYFKKYKNEDEKQRRITELRKELDNLENDD